MLGALFIAFIIATICSHIAKAVFLEYKKLQFLHQAESSVNALPHITNPQKFAQELEPSEKEHAHLDTTTGVSIIGDKVGFYKSSLYPHKVLDERLVIGRCTEYNSDYREIYKDTSWKVFWVRIMNCHNEGKDEMFGPYKYMNDF